MIYLIDWHFLKGEIVQYETATCEECPLGKMTLGISVYRPSVSKQEVVWRMPGRGGVNKYTDCTVLNRRSWQCSYFDGSGVFGFNNGKYWGTSQVKIELGHHSVNRFGYLYTYWRNAF